MEIKIIKLFLRFGIGMGFLSAVADRFGLWPIEISAWGNWDNFLGYTQTINPLIPDLLIPAVGATATIAEIVFGICLIVGKKTELMAKLSGILLLIFALAISFSSRIKGAFDYSVYAASAGTFALSIMQHKYLELDTVFFNTTK